MKAKSNNESGMKCESCFKVTDALFWFIQDGLALQVCAACSNSINELEPVALRRFIQKKKYERSVREIEDE